MALPRLVIGDLTIPIPIIQGGMGIGVSLAGLASAVADAGGVGVISAAGIGGEESDFKSNYITANSRALRREIREARGRTSGVLGVNIMVALTNYADLVQVSVEEGIDIIFSGAGLPLDLPRHLAGKTSPKLVPIVSSGRAATVICKKWRSRFDRLPDAFVVEGPMAGGHLGFKPDQIANENFRLERLVPEVITAVAAFDPSIPIIAAGGIYTGADIRKYLDMGAKAVQMGTRFVATHECDAAPAFKQAYVDAKKEDMHIIKSPVGLPGRVIRNTFIDKVEDGKRCPFSCPFHCLRGCEYTSSPFCITLALLNAKRGNMDNGLIFAGENAWRVTGIVSVAELFAELINDYDATFHA
ncbi:NAD(P)H-dependent flavin oxidoreductase [Desulfolutivibrio sulfoxidireducens]|uniref:NAD(P)H-dependent flavin oxidoreductase n=1 Tax=Desulfolutivibrio sulfoxidireducens TaxID=2773299 RepID=UPI00159DCB34|nr:nitronate monooxygenase family protein [Desulfolutivibrio sulfoxidireducens]QLA15004.1 nitronate monooxygenase [Desulfolutivibrio sulfoxidireducens]QLA18571.1 nitronate monooxygenase [Desulfolutivibrio sulfoxidireducens]